MQPASATGDEHPLDLERRLSAVHTRRLRALEHKFDLLRDAFYLLRKGMRTKLTLLDDAIRAADETGAIAAADVIEAMPRRGRRRGSKSKSSIGLHAGPEVPGAAQPVTIYSPSPAGQPVPDVGRAALRPDGGESQAAGSKPITNPDAGHVPVPTGTAEPKTVRAQRISVGPVLLNSSVVSDLVARTVALIASGAPNTVPELEEQYYRLVYRLIRNGDGLHWGEGKRLVAIAEAPPRAPDPSRPPRRTPDAVIRRAIARTMQVLSVEGPRRWLNSIGSWGPTWSRTWISIGPRCTRRRARGSDCVGPQMDWSDWSTI